MVMKHIVAVCACHRVTYDTRLVGSRCRSEGMRQRCRGTYVEVPYDFEPLFPANWKRFVYNDMLYTTPIERWNSWRAGHLDDQTFMDEFEDMRVYRGEPGITKLGNLMGCLTIETP